MTATTAAEPLLYIPGQRPVSRMCHAISTKTGRPCRMVAPWDWSPDQGPFYCYQHRGQA